MFKNEPPRYHALRLGCPSLRTKAPLALLRQFPLQTNTTAPAPKSTFPGALPRTQPGMKQHRTRNTSLLPFQKKESNTRNKPEGRQSSHPEEKTRSSVKTSRAPASSPRIPRSLRHSDKMLPQKPPSTQQTRPRTDDASSSARFVKLN